MSIELEQVSVSAVSTIIGNIHQERLYFLERGPRAAQRWPACTPIFQDVLMQIHQGKCADHSLERRMKYHNANQNED